MAVSRGIDATVNSRLGKWVSLARRGCGDRLGRKRHRPQDVRHVVEFLARAAMGAVQHRLPALLALDAARRTNTSASTSSTACCRRATRNVIDMVGHLFVPACRSAIVMIVTGCAVLPALLSINEQSVQCRRPAAMAGQIPDHDRFRRSCSFQGISELIKRIAVMRGLIPDPHDLPECRR